jgi:hypothetical protein
MKKMMLTGGVTLMREMRSAYKISVGKIKRKRPLGKPRHRGEDDMRMDLRETGKM